LQVLNFEVMVQACENMFSAKLGIKLPTQLTIFISLAIASGFLARGTSSILR
jgi:hypothetical protein